MKFRGILALILCMSLLLSSFTFISVSAEAEEETETGTEVSSEIVVYGGAKAIVSMTYDDGQYETAAWMNEMFAKYGLRASCMLIVSRHEATKEKWQAIFDKGYLSPENHSMTHAVLPGTEWSNYESYKQNNTPENYQYELVESKALLESLFGQPNITFAASNNTLWVEAADVVMDTYYAMRKGVRNDIQSIEPVEGTDAAGGWYNLYMRGIDNSTLEENKKYIQQYIDAGGWFISMTHAVVNDSDDPTKPERFEAFYQYLSEKQNAGEIWVTTFADATKYLRERQNSTSEAYMTEDGVFVKVNMKESTGDGLPLSPEIFNLPLTVKVEVPESWRLVSYEIDGTHEYATAFSEDGKRYAHVNVAPNGEEVKLTGVDFCEQPISPSTVGYVTLGGGFTSGDMLVSANTDKLTLDECVKVYAKLDTDDYSESTSAIVPLKITDDIVGSIDVYGIADPTLASAWSSDSINAYNAPANDIFGTLTDKAALITSIPIDGAATYLVDVTAYINDMAEIGAKESTLIFTLSDGSPAKKIPFSFGTSEDVPAGTVSSTAFVPYTFTEDFENKTGKGGFATGGIGTNEKNSFAVGDAEGRLGETTKCIVWKTTRTYERNFLGGVLNALNTLTEADIGSEYRISFMFKAESSGSFVVWLGNSSAKKTYTTYPSDKVATFTVEDGDVGKWIKYTHTFTIDESNIAVDTNKGGQDVCFAITPKSFLQTPESPVMLYLDDIVSTKVNTGAKSAMIPTEHATVGATESGTFVSAEEKEGKNIRKAYISFDSSALAESASSVLNLNITKSYGQVLEIYGLSDIAIDADVTYDTAPASLSGEGIDTSMVYRGVPLYEGVAEEGPLTLDVSAFIDASVTGKCTFVIVTRDVTAKELLTLDFESISITNGVDYTTDGSLFADSGAAVVDGTTVSFTDAFRLAEQGVEYIVSANVSAGVTMKVGDLIAIADEAGELTLTVTYADGIDAVTFTGDSGFSVDDLSVISTDRALVISQDADLILTLASDYDFLQLDAKSAVTVEDDVEITAYIRLVPELVSLSFDGAEYGVSDFDTLYTETADGAEYAVFRKNVSFADFCKPIMLTAAVRTDDGREFIKTYDVSPIAYAERLLDSLKYEEEQALMLDLLSYIEALGAFGGADVSRADDLLYRYDYDVSEHRSDMKPLTPQSVVVSSVSVVIEHDVYVTFTVAKAYSEYDVAVLMNGELELDVTENSDGTYSVTVPMRLAAEDLTVRVQGSKGTFKTYYNLAYTVSSAQDAALAHLADRLAVAVSALEKYALADREV